MKPSLAHFEYTFGVDGRIGGLKKLQMDLVPRGSAIGSEEEVARAVMQDGAGLYHVMDRFVSVLDGLFAEDFLDGRRTCWTDDEKGLVRVGYDYDGRWVPKARRQPEAEVAARLAETFGAPDPEMHGVANARFDLAATVTLSGPRPGEALRLEGGSFMYPQVTVWLGLDHALNTCVFRFTQALQDVDVSAQAEAEIAHLDTTLATDWDRAGRDHCSEYRRAWAEASPEGDARREKTAAGSEAMA